LARTSANIEDSTLFAIAAEKMGSLTSTSLLGIAWPKHLLAGIDDDDNNFQNHVSLREHSDAGIDVGNAAARLSIGIPLDQQPWL
jgi:hypothetical protein